MYLHFLLAALMALSGLASSGRQAQDSGARGRAVGQRAIDAIADTTPRTDPPGVASGGVTIKELDIVVPPVQSASKVTTPNAPLETQAAEGVVVADRLVASKRFESEVVEAGGFQTLGVTWPEKAEIGGLGGQFRARNDGKWSKWIDLEPSDSAPDAGTPDAARSVNAGTDPLSIGNAEAVQLAFAATPNGGPKGLSLALIGSPESPTPDRVVEPTAHRSSSFGEATIQTAMYSTGMVQATTPPRVVSRAGWGAPAQRCTPGVAGSLVGAVVHHTAGSNTYANSAQAMQQIRNDAAYHINTLGWCDIGYNFIVDKFGNTYEGRANSLTQAVVGAHAGGFNSGTVGVSMLGTYDSVPSAATQTAVGQIIGWRLGAYGVEPRSSMTYHTGDGGAGARYKNQAVVLPRVSGHRDVWQTACPGNGGYAALPNIRNIAHDLGYAQRFVEAQSVVKSLYADILLRPVDPTGLQSWSAMLAGGSGQPALVASLTRSDEYIQLRVRNAYQEALGRAPDAAGMANWRRQILAGVVTVDNVKRFFYESDEYYIRSGGTPASFIDRMYRTSFGRSAGASETAAWSQRISTVGRSQVVDGIWFSMEAAVFRAGNYYRVFLKRDPDLPGQQAWGRTLLASGEGAVRVGIAGSIEYRDRAIVRYP